MLPTFRAGLLLGEALGSLDTLSCDACYESHNWLFEKLRELTKELQSMPQALEVEAYAGAGATQAEREKHLVESIKSLQGVLERKSHEINALNKKLAKLGNEESARMAVLREIRQMLTDAGFPTGASLRENIQAALTELARLRGELEKRKTEPGGAASAPAATPAIENCDHGYAEYVVKVRGVQHVFMCMSPGLYNALGKDIYVWRAGNLACVTNAAGKAKHGGESEVTHVRLTVNASAPHKQLKRWVEAQFGSVAPGTQAIVEYDPALDLFTFDPSPLLAKPTPDLSETPDPEPPVPASTDSVAAQAPLEHDDLVTTEGMRDGKPISRTNLRRPLTPDPLPPHLVPLEGPETVTARNVAKGAMWLDHSGNFTNAAGKAEISPRALYLLATRFPKILAQGQRIRLTGAVDEAVNAVASIIGGHTINVSEEGVEAAA